MISTAPYLIPQRVGYVIRDAPVDPYKLPEPIPQDKEELAQLLETAFPNTPELAAGARLHGVNAFKLLSTTESAMEFFKIDQQAARKLLALLRIGEFMYAPPVGNVPLMRSIEDVYKHCQQLTTQLEEHLVVLLVSKNYQLAHQQTVAIGHAAGLSIEMGAILQPAMERKIDSLILVHNHPSGDPTPSPEDIAFSQKLKAAAAMFGIEILDHVIVARDGYASALYPNKQ